VKGRAVRARPAASAPVESANRIASCFEQLRLANRKAFIAYICAGDPDLETTAELVPAMAQAGVDIIELGIPYSDPMADGPANQAACERALRSGTTVAGVLDCVRRIRERSQVPLLFFTYLNPILAYGIDRFAKDAVAAGVDGVLCLDLPPDEDAPLLEALRSAGLATVCLAAPTTPVNRKRLLAKASRGFLYYVCRLGVTGERASLPEDLERQVTALRKICHAPVCVGFGISTPEQAAQAARWGDGVIVGSHLVRLIESQGKTPGLVATVAQRAGELAAAVHGLG
jgi:tryptophan synthase alpha chain